MKRGLAIFLLTAAPLCCLAQRPPEPAKVDVEQLTSRLAAATGQDDAHVAAELSGMQLTQRLSAGRMARLSARCPGDNSRQALTILADSAALLGPPDEEIVGNPTPDAASLRQMLVAVVNYANSSLHQLPSFIATRTTTAFEDRPQEDVLEPTGTVSYSYLPLHLVGRSNSEVTYRDGHELAGTAKKASHEANVHGLITAGEFGPFLNTVLADAVKGKITWSRWEQGIDGVDAVFHFSVTQTQSHYLVQFCCIQEEAFGAPKLYTQRAAYHGDIMFNPTTGVILRMAIEAELTAGELVDSAGMVVEYVPTQIGAKTVVLPAKSVSILKAHTTPPPAGMHMAAFKGPAKTFLNDIAFENYHQYRGEMRMVPEEHGAPSAPEP